MERAGVEDFTFHGLRHTFATRLAQSGVDPLQDIQVALT
jgi:integrase